MTQETKALVRFDIVGRERKVDRLQIPGDTDQAESQVLFLTQQPFDQQYSRLLDRHRHYWWYLCTAANPPRALDGLAAGVLHLAVDTLCYRELQRTSHDLTSTRWCSYFIEPEANHDKFPGKKPDSVAYLHADTYGIWLVMTKTKGVE